MLVILTSLISLRTRAQIVLTSPADRVVYQRDAANQFNLQVHGYVEQCVESVEFRLVPISSRPSGPVLGSPAPATGWMTVSPSGICSNFSGSLTVTGGWYRLEARAFQGGVVTYTTTVDHVGVGEVFVIAGQSNATGGDSNPTGPGATEDAVSSVNFQNLPIQPYSDVELPCPEYVHLDQYTKTAPFGNYAWCWGVFGDKMVQKLGVPVMIFNAGWSSTGAWNWKESIDYNSATPTISYWGYSFPKGLPFGHLRLALNNYIAQLGVRAVLWHQGETDNAAERNQTTYYNDLRSVIEATRSLSGKATLPWVVAQASRFTVNDVSRVWEPVIAAQRAIAGLDLPEQKMSGVFPGPDTDPYFTSEYRSDGIHFSGNGLNTLAELWADKLDTPFFTNATPYQPIPSPVVSIQGAGAETRLTANTGWDQYGWLPSGSCHNPIDTTNSVKPGPGVFRVKTTDNYQNVVFSPNYFIPSTALPVRLASFDGKAAEGQVMLQWTTAQEDNVDYFEVERTTDLKNFTSLGRVSAEGFSSQEVKYDFFDRDLASGQYYYRLKSVDRDLTFSYSRMAAVKVESQQILYAYPNPATGHIYVQGEGRNVATEIYNSTGQIIKQFTTQGSREKVDINTLTPGLYTIRQGGQSYNFIKTAY